MKKKRFRNYYTKIMVICYGAIFCLIFAITVIVLIYANNKRIVSENAKYEEITSHVAQIYNSVIENRYLIYVPLHSEKNRDSLRQICAGNFSGYDNVFVEDDLERILKEVSQQDAQIVGIYFKRYSDGESYMYFADDKEMRKVSLVLEESQKETDYFTLIGVRRLDYQSKSFANKRSSVFGIHSKPFSSGGVFAEEDYQITLFYSTDEFDDCLSGYNLDPEVRFRVMTNQGLLLYDSFGEYNTNQPVWFENIDIISGNEDSFVEEQITYKVLEKKATKADCLVMCTIPAENLKKFSMNGMMGITIAVAVFINICVIALLLFLNRAIKYKFNMLENGMEQIGRSNLKYRLPVLAQEDEFSRIAARFNKMCDDLQSMVDKNNVYMVLQHKAEYEQLKKHMNPHFLYNSLESIRQLLAEDGQQESSDAVLLLSRILDYQLHGDSIMPIWLELDSLKQYIAFLSVRYRNKFEYSIEFDDKILDYLIPKQVFIPIAENYMEHGFKGDGKDFIHIWGYEDEEDNRIHICFCDNGKGICKERVEQLNRLLKEDMGEEEASGLRDVCNRLRILFGENSFVEIASNEPEPGISVSIIFEKISKIFNLNEGAS